jgi:UDPglucose 6-dehydrogenase
VLGTVVARRVIVDARCALDAALWRQAGWSVHVPGRPRSWGAGGPRFPAS